MVLNLSQFIFRVGPLVSPQACSSRGGCLGSLCKGRDNPLPLQSGRTKPPALATKRQILPPFITYQPKQERSSTGGCCAGPLSSLGFTKCFRSALGEKLQHSTRFGNHPHGTHRDVEQERWVQKYCEAFLPEVEQC